MSEQRLQKITYILANIDKALAFEWIVGKLKNDFEFSFILLGEKEGYLFDWLKAQGIECYFLQHTGKKSFPKSYFRLRALLKKIKPDIVHTHLRDANLLGLTAAKRLSIKKRIYTRHHSTFHHQYFPKAVKWDKYCNRIATDIVAISQNVKNVLVEKENVNPNKITLIHHGFDLEKFQNVTQTEIEVLRNKYHLQKTDYPVVGVISRYIKLKGIQYIIPAFKSLLKDYPNAKLVLANSRGPDKDFIQNLLKNELLPKQYIEIPFEKDLFALYQLFDVFVHVPINKEIEAFGQTYVEALAAGIPAIFTLSGIAPEFVKDKENALVVPFENSQAIYKALTTTLESKSETQKRIVNGKKSLDLFRLDLFAEKLKNLYES